MEEKYLPIGSVVKLKDGEKNLMITGFLQYEDNKDGKKEIYDYCGCLYPEEERFLCHSKKKTTPATTSGKTTNGNN